jgi:dihydrofolate reductase
MYVLSNSLKSIPEGYEGKAETIKGSLSEVIESIHQKGYKHFYIDGGVTVQSFLKEDLIDEMIITVIPILLGGGIPLFGELPKQMEFEVVKTEVFLNAIVQNHYRRKK